MPKRHHVKSWKKRLRVSVSIAKLISNSLGAVYYFQLLYQELAIGQDMNEFLEFLSAFY